MTGLVHVGADEPSSPPIRWECRCQPTPVLLATYDAGGRIHIKARDRHWYVSGAVHTVCPRCGAEHALDLRRKAEGGRRADDITDQTGDTNTEAAPPDT
jgi:hypothetical protein